LSSPETVVLRLQGEKERFVAGKTHHGPYRLGPSKILVRGQLLSASSSCTPTFFFLHPQNFLNPKTDLNLLFEKGHRG